MQRTRERDVPGQIGDRRPKREDNAITSIGPVQNIAVRDDRGRGRSFDHDASEMMKCEIPKWISTICTIAVNVTRLDVRPNLVLDVTTVANDQNVRLMRLAAVFVASLSSSS